MRVLFVKEDFVVVPLGIMYLSGALRKAGHTTELVKTDEDILRKVKEFKPSIIAYSVMTGSQKEFLKINNQIKKKFPEVFSLMGGPHPTFFPEVIKEAGLDAICIGEAEEAFVELATKLENGENITTIKNTWIKKKGKIYKNDVRPLVENLDKLAFPDRELVYKYKKYREGPIKHFIAARGCPYNCSYCFVGDSLIHTSEGVKSIKELYERQEPNLKVLSSNGEWRKVNNYFKRRYSGQIINIKPFKNNEYVSCTEDHKFFIFREGKIKEIKAKDIKMHDMLCIPTLKEKAKKELDVYEELEDIKFNLKCKRKVDFDKIERTINLFKAYKYSTRKIGRSVGLSKSYVHQIIYNYKRGVIPTEDKEVLIKLENKNGYLKFSNSKSSIPNKLKLNKDFLRLSGYYLAEGSVLESKDRPNSLVLVFSFGEYEKEYIEDVKELIKKIFNIKAAIVKDKTATKVYVYNNVLGRLFKKMFGGKARNKKLPYYFLNLNCKLQLELLKGWIRGDGDKNLYCATTSRTLAYQLFLLSYKIGFNPGLYRYKTRKSKIGKRVITYGNDYYALIFHGKEEKNLLRDFVYNDYSHNIDSYSNNHYLKFKNFILIPIRDIKKENFKGYVYNLEIDKDHTYTVNNIAIHNCFNASYSELYKGKGLRVRWRSVDNLIKEIKEVIQKYPTKVVYFQDDTFILNRFWLREFSEKYTKEINLPYHCHVRANLVDDEVCKLLRDSNCYSVHIAAESGNDYIRNDILNRGMTKEEILNAAKLLHKYGIKFMMQNMIGLPKGNLNADFETLKLNIKCKPTYAWVSIFKPYPGTKLGLLAVEEGYCKKEDLSNIEGGFFDESMMDIKNKKEVENLQKIFGLVVKYPFLYYTGIVDLMIRMPQWLVRDTYKDIYTSFRRKCDNDLYGVMLD